MAQPPLERKDENVSNRIRAVVFSGAEAPLEVTEVKLEPPGPAEVRVRIAAAGVCHSDLHVLRGEWELPLPLVMGHEGAGVVTELGPNVTELELGDHVVLCWQPACRRCRFCQAGYPSQCELVARVVAPGGVLYDGTSRLSRDGQRIHHYLGVSSFAEEAVVPETGAIRIRRDMPLDRAALVGCCVATGVGAVLRTARVEEGSTAVVIGCGAVGLSAIQGAVIASSSRIVAVDLLEHKLETAARLGATDLVNASKADPVEAVRDLTGGGADYVFDAIGLPATTEQAVQMLGLGGTAVVVGLPPTGARASFEPLVLAEAEQRILGSNYGSVRPAIDFPLLVDLDLSGRLRIDELITGHRPLAEVNEAFEDLVAGRAIRTILEPL